jgi:hypothetical protein
VRVVLKGFIVVDSLVSVKVVFTINCSHQKDSQFKDYG